MIAPRQNPTGAPGKGRDKAFIRFPHALADAILDARLSGGSVRLLVAIAKQTIGYQRAWISKPYGFWAKLARLNKHHVDRHLRDLAEAGFIAKRAGHRKGKGSDATPCSLCVLIPKNGGVFTPEMVAIHSKNGGDFAPENGGDSRGGLRSREEDFKNTAVKKGRETAVAQESEIPSVAPKQANRSPEASDRLATLRDALATVDCQGTEAERLARIVSETWPEVPRDESFELLALVCEARAINARASRPEHRKVKDLPAWVANRVKARAWTTFEQQRARAKRIWDTAEAARRPPAPAMLRSLNAVG